MECRRVVNLLQLQHVAKRKYKTQWQFSLKLTATDCDPLCARLRYFYVPLVHFSNTIDLSPLSVANTNNWFAHFTISRRNLILTK